MPLNIQVYSKPLKRDLLIYWSLRELGKIIIYLESRMAPNHRNKWEELSDTGKAETENAIFKMWRGM